MCIRDSPSATARFFRPFGVAVAPNGTVYVADYLNHRIRAIDPTTGTVTTLAGNGTAGFVDGPGATAQFTGPSGVTVNSDGTVYVADRGNQRIRAIESTTGQVTTFAGNGTAGFVDGPGATAQFTGPSGVTVNSDGLSLIHI